MTSAAPSRYRIASMLLVLAVSLTVRAQNPLLPSGVAYDASGNLYFADTNRHQVFESTLAGALLVVAGNGTQAFSGDGGPATAASLDSPQSVAVASNGTIYIADTGNQRIRAITAGTITTLAGTGAAGFAGDSEPASAAIFSHPNALAIDSTGALLICDSGNHRIRRIAGGIVTTVAGSGVQGFSGDNGAALLAQLDTPSGITVAADGRIFLADTHNIASASLIPAATSAPTREPESLATQAMVPRRHSPSWRCRAVFLRLPRACSSSLTATISAFVRSMPRASSQPSPAVARRAPATMARRLRARP